MGLYGDNGKENGSYYSIFSPLPSGAGVCKYDFFMSGSHYSGTYAEKMVPSPTHMPILCEPGHTCAARCRPQFLCNSAAAPLRGDSPYPSEELSAAAGQTAVVVVVVVAVVVVEAEEVKVLKLGRYNYGHYHGD